MTGGRKLGIAIAVLGFVVLLVGASMPDTTTHTSRTCVDDPNGFGQECYSGGVTTQNTTKGPTVAAGLLALLGGLGAVLLAGDDPSGERQSVPEQSHRASQPREFDGPDTGGNTFADQLENHRSGSSDDDPGGSQ